MGLLLEDKILSWKDTKKYKDYYKNIAIIQFINLYNKYKNNNAIPFFWGYETEYMLVKQIKDKYKLNLISSNIRKKMKSQNKDCWLPEYSEWMIEKISDSPFNEEIKNIENIEYFLNEDLKQINSQMKENEYAILLSSFPLLGSSKNIFNIKEKYLYDYSKSKMIPDNIINKHIRFRTLTKNIRERRGKKVNIIREVFQDEKTNIRKMDMDCMAFGMGNCCSQVTIQCKNLEDATYLYDQFAILSPLLLYLSSASPFINGYLTESQNRWKTIEQSVDDRNKNENIMKSRYSTISRFINSKGQKYNDLKEEYNETCYKTLKENNIPDNISKHISYLFLRDPIIMYENDIKKNKELLHNETDFFVNINSSNWNNVRLKPPMNNKDSWKIEVRILDIQTDNFKNASFIIYILMLARIILHYKLNFYIPLSYVEENFSFIESRSFNKKMYTNMFWNKKKKNFSPKITDIKIIVQKINSIIYKFINETNIPIKIDKYLSHIENISNQKENTNAEKLHKFIINHPEYDKDSKINYKISNDLIQEIINGNI
jgi:glutamate--cysteine ligase catalytic subunit